MIDVPQVQFGNFNVDSNKLNNHQLQKDVLMQSTIYLKKKLTYFNAPENKENLNKNKQQQSILAVCHEKNEYPTIPQVIVGMCVPPNYPSLQSSQRMEVQGFKAGPHFYQGFQEVFIVLDQSSLSYSKRGGSALGKLDFDLQQFNVDLVQENGVAKKIMYLNTLTNNSISTEQNPKKFVFKAKTPDDTKILFEAIYNRTQKSQGNLKNLNLVAIYPQFWRKNFATNEAFLRDCNTGDILLFRTDHTLAKTQRFVTGGDYDHVAIVLKDKNGVQIVEATGNEGVSEFLWEQFVLGNYYFFYERIAWRKLVGPNELSQRQAIQDMEETIPEYLHHEYNLNTKKIINGQMLGKSIIPQKGEKKSFFCSELVAFVYKRANLLNADLASAYYFPVDFTEAKKLKLLKDFSLEQERFFIFPS